MDKAMTQAQTVPPWKAYDDVELLRWIAAYPVTKITSVGPAVIDGTAPQCELHQQLPDQTWRSTRVFYYWIQMGGIATLHVSKCGMVHVDPAYIKRLQEFDLRHGVSAEIIKCSCGCGNVYYNPANDEIE